MISVGIIGSMKKALIIVVVAVITANLGVVRAISVPVMLNNDQIEYIRNNCADTQIVMRNLHATDALARINMVQHYTALSTRMMAPMNSRVALNKLDGVELTKITVSFNEELEHFRSAQGLYPDYERTMSNAISMKCYDQPVEFYDNLNLVLKKRAGLRESVDKLKNLLKQYRDQVGVIERQIADGVQKQ